MQWFLMLQQTAPLGFKWLIFPEATQPENQSKDHQT
jgi:hypothetical protein